jgi:predicted phage baseplate assembly protein
MALPPHHSVRLSWDYVDATGNWHPLEPAAVVDGTRSLTLNGRVVLRLPSPTEKWTTPPSPAPGHYLRCRVVAGAYDAAPVARQVLFNAVEAEQAVRPVNAKEKIEIEPSIYGEPIGTGNGWPEQEFALSEKPVHTASLRIFTAEGEAHWPEWSLVADFDASGPADRHMTLDATQGLVQCGDGAHGRVAPPNTMVFAHYETTQGARGNVTANAVWDLPDCPANGAAEKAIAAHVRVTNPAPASGGADAETIVQAAGRAVRKMQNTPRAVTLADYERLTLHMPGVRVARAIARANEHPDFPCLPAAGIVTVTIMPYLPVGRLSPSSGLIQAVSTYLNRRRILGTRIVVAGPIYVVVTVQATLDLQRGANAGATSGRARDNLARFFDPLAGGPDGTGWPLGRDVYRSEVLQVLDETEGVDNVGSLVLFADDGPASCGNLCIGPRGLVASGAHRITAAGGATSCLTAS